MSYANATEVSVEKSKGEIERTLQRYGADEFASGWQAGRAMLQFKMRERVIRFVLPLPDKSEKRFWETPARRKRRSEAEAFASWEQACRQRWRALLLCIKAKLESIDAGIEQFDTAFLAQIVLPNGVTVGESVLPAVKQAYLTGKMPDALLLTE